MTARSKKARIGVVAGVSLLATTVITGFEGKENKAYRDIVGVPTICQGLTEGVKIGDYKTDAECDALFLKTLAVFEDGVLRCTPMMGDQPPKRLVAMVSHAYNVGVFAYCKSTMARKLNAGDIKGACNELPKWTRAGGKIVFGLVRRRAAERAMCLEGL